MAIKKEIIIEVNNDQANKKLDEVNKSLNNSEDATKGLTSSLDNMTGGAISGFKGMLGGIRTAITAMKSLKIAIVATGIGVLVVAVGSLVAYFQKSEEGAQKLRIAFAAVGAIVDKLVDGLIAVGKFLAKVGQITGDVIKGNKSLKEGWNDAKEAGKEMGAEIKAAYDSLGGAMEKAISLQERENALIVRRRKGLVEEAKLLVDLSEARSKVGDVLLSNTEREKAANDAIELNNELYNEKISKLREEYEIQKARNALASSSEDDMMKEAELQAALIQLTADRNNANKELITQRSGLLKAEQDRLKAEQEANKKALEERNKAIDDSINADIKAEEERLSKIKAVQDSFKTKQEDEAATTEAQKIMLAQQRDLAALEALGATEEQMYNIKKYYADKIDQDYQKQAQAKKDLDAQVAMAGLSIASQTASLLLQMANKDSKIYKGLQIAQIVASGVQSVQNAFMTANASPITSVFPAYPYVQAGLAGAFSAVQLAKLKQGGGSSRTSSSTGGSNAPRAAAPSFNIVSGTAGNQINDSLNNNSKAPIKAYVVGSDVSTQQEMDRKIVSNASI